MIYLYKGDEVEEIIKRKLNEREQDKKQLEEIMSLRKEILITASAKEKDKIFKEISCDIVNLKVNEILIDEFNNCLKEYNKSKWIIHKKISYSH